MGQFGVLEGLSVADVYSGTLKYIPRTTLDFSHRGNGDFYSILDSFFVKATHLKCALFFHFLSVLSKVMGTP
jgi:hypothetical protein